MWVESEGGIASPHFIDSHLFYCTFSWRICPSANILPVVLDSRGRDKISLLDRVFVTQAKDQIMML
jgi:hypothetical protein